MDDQTNKLLTGYLTEEELARELRRSARTIFRWRNARNGPPFTLIGRKPMYRIESAREWLRAREVRIRRGTRNK
jgi:hypothetical protein